MSGSGSGSALASGKKTKGKQKIEIKKIENENDRLISFSKRRAGIYKKASELNILCGAEIAFIVFSPAGKPFAFGHPSIEYVANRFLNQNIPPNNNSYTLVEAHRQTRINQISQQLNEHLNQLDVEKQRANMLAQQISGNTTPGWWEVNIDQVDEKDLHGLYSSFEKIRNDALVHKNERIRFGEGFSQHTPMDPAQLTYPFPTNANVEVPPVSLPLGNEWINAGVSSLQHAPMGPAQFTNPFLTYANVEVPLVLSPHGNEWISAGASSSHAPMSPAWFTNPFPANANVVEAPPFFLPSGNEWIGAGASSSQQALMGPAQFTNPFPPNENAGVPDVFPPSYGQGHQQF